MLCHCLVHETPVLNKLNKTVAENRLRFVSFVCLCWIFSFTVKQAQKSPGKVLYLLIISLIFPQMWLYVPLHTTNLKYASGKFSWRCEYCSYLQATQSVQQIWMLHQKHSSSSTLFHSNSLCRILLRRWRQVRHLDFLWTQTIKPFLQSPLRWEL